MKKILTFIGTALFALVLIAAPVLAEDSFPAKYDPRPDNVSQIRTQVWGTCWDFAGIASLECSLIKNGIADKSIDLSEEDVLWHSSSIANPEFFGWMLKHRSDGAYAYTVVGYLITQGAKSEADIPYLKSSGDSDQDYMNGYYNQGTNQLPANFYTAKVIYEVTDVAFYENPNPETVKKAIMENGAIGTSYLDNPDYFNSATSSFWNTTVESAGNHTVTVVGWDDNFSKNNFKEQAGKLPENDGAWLIKNSYGPDYGSEGGFIWVSYEDAMIFKSSEYNPSYSVKNARIPLDQKRYYSDDCGIAGFYNPTEKGSATFANVYDFGKDEKISELSFGASSAGNEYKIYYAPVENDLPVTDENKWIILASGEVPFAGYITVPAENTFNVPEGKGAIVITFSGEKPGIGTDENLLYGTRTLLNTKINKNAYYLDGSKFVPAEKDKTIEVTGFSYKDPVDFVLRAYTVPVKADPVDPAKTGDSNNLVLYFVIFGAGIITLVLLINSLRRKSD